MKMKIVYTLFFLAGSAFLFISSSGGAGAAQGRDRTMSPLSGSSSCATCHNSGAFSPSIKVQLLDGENPVSVWEPEKTYTLSVAIEDADAAEGYGFQAVLLAGDNDSNAGMFGTPSDGIQVTTLNEVDYAEHNTSSTDNVFTIDWTAPAAGLGDIRIYAAGNAANNNASTQGDQGVFLTEPVVISEMGPSIAEDRLLRFDEISIFPNPTPAAINLRINNSRAGRYTLDLFNAMGQKLQSQNVNLVQGIQTHRIDLTDQPQGVYFLQISDGQQILSKRILKH